jgi:hypothetical protein
MATWEDVRRLALALPETSEKTHFGEFAAWQVKAKTFAWERPLRDSDVAALGDAVPTGPTVPPGPILAARVPDEGAKEALIADDPAVYFTIPHFNGYPAILVRLDQIDLEELEEVLVEAWLCKAPKRVAAAYRSGA